jgi:hypothetical protein
MSTIHVEFIKEDIYGNKTKCECIMFKCRSEKKALRDAIEKNRELEGIAYITYDYKVTMKY